MSGSEIKTFFEALLILAGSLLIWLSSVSLGMWLRKRKLEVK